MSREVNAILQAQHIPSDVLMDPVSKDLRKALWLVSETMCSGLYKVEGQDTACGSMSGIYHALPV